MKYIAAIGGISDAVKQQTRSKSPADKRIDGRQTRAACISSSLGER